MQRLAAEFGPLAGLQPKCLPAFKMLRSAVLSEAERAGIAAHMAKDPARWPPLSWPLPQ